MLLYLTYNIDYNLYNIYVYKDFFNVLEIRESEIYEWIYKTQVDQIFLPLLANSLQVLIGVLFL